MKLYYHKIDATSKYRYEIKYIINGIEHSIWFGERGRLTYLDVSDRRKKTYIENEEEREKIKNDFLSTIDKTKLNDFKSKETFEYYLLYNTPSLKQSVILYQKEYGVFLRYGGRVKIKHSQSNH